ncbi:RNA-binding protein [Comamonas faecalis]|uniref:RNA-binding protein n=2 Tax=Comamonas faecalis TaxID=1387849 RepID=A0ABP7QKU8_9BURK
MNNKLYVGNLAYSVTSDTLNELFSQFGTVASAKVMTDRDTGRSKGFGFVEMDNAAQAQAVIDGTNGRPVEGRNLTVNIARPMEPRQSFGGGDRGGYRGQRY